MEAETRGHLHERPPVNFPAPCAVGAVNPIMQPKCPLPPPPPPPLTHIKLAHTNRRIYPGVLPPAWKTPITTAPADLGTITLPPAAWSEYHSNSTCSIYATWAANHFLNRCRFLWNFLPLLRLPGLGNSPLVLAPCLPFPVSATLRLMWAHVPLVYCSLLRRMTCN